MFSIIIVYNGIKVPIINPNPLQTVDIVSVDKYIGKWYEIARKPIIW